jgi:hypothetical protein
MRGASPLVKVVKGKRQAVHRIGSLDSSTEGRGRTALVTGASAGIGRCMAELLAAKGYDVVVVARRERLLKEARDELERRWGVRVHPLRCDLTEPDAAVTIRDDLSRQGLAVDFLVNNAAYIMVGKFLDHPWEHHLRLCRLLALNVVELCHHLMPHMVERGWGRIINVTSLGALMAGAPDMALYVASKSFVLKFSESIAAEYESAGVHTTVSLPGATATALYDDTEIAEHMQNSVFMQLAMMRPEQVAREAYAACMKRKRIIVHGWHNKAFAFALVHSPPAVRYGLVEFSGKMQSPQPAP